MEDWNKGDKHTRLLNIFLDSWTKQVTKAEAKKAKSNHTVKMMLRKDHHKNVVSWARRFVARDFKQQSLRNALPITVSEDREKNAIWSLDECDVGGQTICPQAIPARMTCDNVFEWVGEEVLKEYKNLHHTRGLQGGDRSVIFVGEGSGGEAAMDLTDDEGGDGLDDDDEDDEPAQNAVCAFVANNLQKGGNRGSWKPFQQGWKEREKKEPNRVGDPPLSFIKFIRAHPQGCLVCYGRNNSFRHDHRTCPVHKADTEADKKGHGSTERASANVRETTVEEELFKRTDLAKEIQEIKMSWTPKQDKDKDKDKDKKGKGRWRKEGRR